MQDQTKPLEVFAQFAGKALETLTVWADANQRVVRELVNLSAATATESASGIRRCSWTARLPI